MRANSPNNPQRAERFVVDAAARIVEECDRENAADAMLRTHLKAQRDLSARQTRRISRAVFAYFRWLGWLDQQRPLPSQIGEAQDLAEKFAHEPASFSETDLIARAVPAWIGNEMDVTGAWVRSLQSEPKLWLRARAGQGVMLAEKLSDPFHGQECVSFGQGSLEDTLEYRGETDLFKTSEFHAGEFELQDLSSQVVGLVCAPNPGETWWDACTGEGGKLLHLADLMKNRGLIWASDRAEWRLKKLKRRAARAQIFNYRAKLWDGGSRLPTKTLFDGVLVDAPCSGVGTWQRNPHARWTTTAVDVEELGEVQRKLLAHSAAAVKPGGKLIYAVCTLPRKETVAVAERFGREFSQFDPLEIKNPLDVDVPVSNQIMLRPEDCGGNGMFIAAWIRRKN